jgi:hypothetical protein
MSGVTLDDLRLVVCEEEGYELAALALVGHWEALLYRINALAGDLGQLRRAGSSPAYLVDRIAAHIESLDVMCRPTAADLLRAWDSDSPEKALRLTDRRSAQLRRLMGEEPR